MCLKEQKVMMDQQWVEVMIHMLRQGIQKAVDIYNTFQSPPSPNVEVINTKYVVVPQSRLCNETPPSTTFFCRLIMC